MLFSAILARKLGVQDFGRFAYISSLVFLGNTFTNFGTDTLLVRETARAEQVTDLASRSLSLQLILTVLYCLALLVLRDMPLFIYSLALFPLTVFSINNALLRALSRFDLFWFLSFINAAVQVAAAFLFWDVLTLCLSLLFGQILVSIISLLFCRASLPEFSLLPLKSFSSIFKLVLPFAALTVLLVLIQRLGILFTSILLDDADTGYFSAVTRIIEGLKLGHYAILGALLPALSKGGAESWKNFRKAFLLLLSASGLFAVMLFFISKPLIQFLFGAEFISASSNLSLLGWSLLPYTVSSFISYDLIVRGKETVVLKAALLSVSMYVVLYVLLIPAFGLKGAILSALYGEWIQGFIFILFYKPGIMVTSNESR